MGSNIGKSTGNSSDGDTLSTFLVKTVLLMDNSGGSKGTIVTEYDASNLTQTWENSSGFKETATNMLSALWENIKKPIKYLGSKVGIDTEIATKELKVPYVATASDGFDAYNIAYYRALFNGMNQVYIHLQNLLFIVVGGFFLATLGGGKIQKYLENRGQSTGNKEPYLHKFFIPLLCAGVFYMPITSGGGVNSTMIQKIIQYFTAEANHIADVASSIGSSTYVQKMIADVGAKDFVTDDNKLLGEVDKMKAEFIKKRTAAELKYCVDRYNTDKNFNFAQYDALKWEEFAAKEQLQGGGDKKDGFFAGMWKGFKAIFEKKKQNISLQACTQLSQEIQNAQKTKEKIEQARKELEKQGADSESVKVKERAKTTITNTQEMIQTNESFYGWLNSLIVPASVLMLEAQAGYKVAMEQSPDDLKEELDKQTELVAGKAGTESITKDLGH